MGSHEQAVMGLESQAVSDWVTKHFVTIYSNNNFLSSLSSDIHFGFSKEPSQHSICFS